MRHLLYSVVICVGLSIGTFMAQTQAPASQAQPPASADPYANNARPGTLEFPLAAPAGKDSNARMTAPAGAINQGPFNPGSWKYGNAFNPPKIGRRSSSFRGWDE